MYSCHFGLEYCTTNTQTCKMEPRQIDCFKMHMKFWKFLGIWPDKSYYYYSKVFVLLFVLLFNILYTLNMYFLPRKLEIFAEQMILYLIEVFVLSKVFTFLILHHKIKQILDTLESDAFRPDDKESANIVDNAKVFVIWYWRIVTVMSVTSYFSNILSPLIMHLFLSNPLGFPVLNTVSQFISEKMTDRLIYLLYFYQVFSDLCHMLYNLNCDSFIMGLMVLTIAQLRILDVKLRNITTHNETADSEQSTSREDTFMLALKKCIIHYQEISKFCELVQDVFNVVLFAQIGVSSCILCVCLFRFTLPAPLGYYVFLTTFIAVIMSHILVPCWFGTRLIETSSLLSTAIYSCDWTPRSRQFKSSLRLFVERANKPLSLTAGKMFPLSLQTFTSIMNSAYSFFTLLRHMQSRNA